MLFDQMRPEYADRFGMTNFKSIRDGGRYFKKSYVGYMGSETVISHNAIVSGQLPKHMGWVDEAYRDTKNLLGGGAGKMWVTGDLTLAQFQTIIEDEGYPKLADYLHKKSPGSKFIAVGEKSYAVESAVAGTGDIGVRLSSRVSDGSCPAIGIYRKPAGRNVPAYLSDPACGRYSINSDKANDFGTLGAFPSWMYPEDGDRFFPGDDPAHLGGDVWAADAAMAMMENENWSGMFVTLGGIDKAGHMWGAYHDQSVDPSDPGFQTHVPEAARTADEQFGRILAKLQALGQLDDTLIVLTADHGATYAENFYGKPTLNAGDTELVRRRLGQRRPVPRSVAGTRAADRDRQRAVLVPVDVDPGLADRCLEGEAEGGHGGADDDARRDGDLPPRRPSLQARRPQRR